MTEFRVAALYKFTPLQADKALQDKLLSACQANGVMGTLLIASEGINGTIAGSHNAIEAVLDVIRSLPGCGDIEHKDSAASEQPFLRMKVRLKKEIVTLGVPGVDPSKAVGTYVEPEDWNDLISAEDVVTIDTRNDYEVRIGQFKGAVNPETTSFREFPEWFRKFRETRPNARIAMYCTGGIRCEKSTAFALTEGLDEVFHLKGGILKYLERIPEDDSLWDGDCFVFDRRVAVRHGLEEGDYTTCHACREPLAPEDLKSPLFVAGESCPHCHAERTGQQRQRYAERQRQEELAAARGERHVGAVYRTEGEDE
ncbi:rhodanese-related sulfurtransferase [Hyphobacterium sp. HN65]|uniref:tRNA uridine(34) hydroxylase n=1 Tax=Hyphobacterium lacteum TaxID=3116575 RepID=A0ABU7LTV9_9PROT|nr:rhodanese-related sulfurtransferase [Hyphobacterium sp. HN65]MEE2527360.1 rhodanese-related sulfurtransferase [Hyphobacterium sp. HN65]